MTEPDGPDMPAPNEATASPLEGTPAQRLRARLGAGVRALYSQQQPGARHLLWCDFRDGIEALQGSGVTPQVGTWVPAFALLLSIQSSVLFKPDSSLHLLSYPHMYPTNALLAVPPPSTPYHWLIFPSLQDWADMRAAGVLSVPTRATQNTATQPRTLTTYVDLPALLKLVGPDGPQFLPEDDTETRTATGVSCGLN